MRSALLRSPACEEDIDGGGGRDHHLVDLYV